jgi:hypothetical protein
MARHGRRAKQRRTKEIILGTIAFLFVGIVAVVITHYVASRPKEIDSQTLCPPNGPMGHYVLLVDKTDPLTFTQKQAFSVNLHELIEKRVPVGYLLSVFVLGEEFKENAAPLVELCNPGKGDGKTEMTDNLKRLRLRYENKFIEPLLKQSDALLATRSAATSPILEMLQLVGINGFQKHDIKGERRLIVMSDMLHNTKQMSMYRTPVDYAVFAATDYGRKTQSDLRGVAVELHYLMNAPQLQTKRNVNFWENYFDKAGAHIVEVRPLEG